MTNVYDKRLHVSDGGDYYYPGHTADGTFALFMLTRKQAMELGRESGVIYDNGRPNSILLSDIFHRSCGSRLRVSDKQTLDDWFPAMASVLPASLVYFPRRELVRTDIFAQWCADAKANDPAHAYDRNNEYKRQRTGKLCEVAVQMAFGIEFIDWNIRPRSAESNIPDLLPAGLAVGVKGAMWPNAPLIPVRHHEPQIFVLLSEDYTHAVVLGYAPPQTLKEEAESGIGDAFVLCDSVLHGKKDPKTGFAAFDRLERARSLESLSMYVHTDDPSLITSPHSESQMQELYNPQLEAAVEEQAGNFWDTPDDWYQAEVPEPMCWYRDIITAYPDDAPQNAPWRS